MYLVSMFDINPFGINVLDTTQQQKVQTIAWQTVDIQFLTPKDILP